MTCIVAIKKGKKVYMGGDSAASNSSTITCIKTHKVFINQGFLFGCCGSARMAQSLMFGWNPPKRHADLDIYEYMVTEFIDSVRDRLKKSGVTKIDNNVEKTSGCFLVATPGVLYTIYGDFQVGEAIADYAATGCGEEYAKGAIHALMASKKDLEPEQILEAALQAATEHSPFVAAPFTFKSI